MGIYLPEKVILNITFRVDKFLCLPNLKLTTILLLVYDFSTVNGNFLLSLCN